MGIASIEVLKYFSAIDKKQRKKKKAKQSFLFRWIKYLMHCIRSSRRHYVVLFWLRSAVLLLFTISCVHITFFFPLSITYSVEHTENCGKFQSFFRSTESQISDKMKHFFHLKKKQKTLRNINQYHIGSI